MLKEKEKEDVSLTIKLVEENSGESAAEESSETTENSVYQEEAAEESPEIKVGNCP